MCINNLDHIKQDVGRVVRSKRGREKERKCCICDVINAESGNVGAVKGWRGDDHGSMISLLEIHTHTHTHLRLPLGSQTRKRRLVRCAPSNTHRKSSQGCSHSSSWSRCNAEDVRIIKYWGYNDMLAKKKMKRKGKQSKEATKVSLFDVDIEQRGENRLT